MNFLAHSLFANRDPLQVVGQFCGDFVRGSDLSRFAPGIADAIVLHRQIDAYTDQHPELLLARGLFEPPVRRFAGIVTDICFDHFIARNWSAYSEITLASHSNEVHRALQDNYSVLPERLQRFSRYLIKQRLLESYSSFEGVKVSLARIAQRSPRFAPLECAAASVEPHLIPLEHHFDVFFPQLSNFVETIRTHNPAQGVAKNLPRTTR